MATVREIADVLGVDLDNLFGRKETVNTAPDEDDIFASVEVGAMLQTPAHLYVTCYNMGGHYYFDLANSQEKGSPTLMCHADTLIQGLQEVLENAKEEVAAAAGNNNDDEEGGDENDQGS